MAKVINVGIPVNLYKKIKKRVEKTEFKTTQEYITYILEEVIKQVEEEETGDDEVFSEEDEEKVKDRLRALGYLD